MKPPTSASLAGGVGSLTLVALSLAELSATPGDAVPVRRAVPGRIARRVRCGSARIPGHRRGA